MFEWKRKLTCCIVFPGFQLKNGNSISLCISLDSFAGIFDRTTAGIDGAIANIHKIYKLMCLCANNNVLTLLILLFAS